ncbi:extracellular matrix-binding ebh [Babesia caballi]|uniref:Extracellular matrix-binding ebh n=1 Tax=Babesia caballi TaxID=5871 RepID=A0AAV4LYE2_BABCB|nr:extracellular matrix-binding ebh [Babesia caballi]
MGFASVLTKDDNATGWHIYYLLDHFCSGWKTPLRQLSEKLGCLTKRTPRTLGDVFGFIWHLNGQLFKDAQIMYGFKTAVKQKPPSVEDFITRFKTAMRSHRSRLSPEQTVYVKSFESMGQTIPFFYQLYTIEESNSVPDALFDLTYHCHKWESGSRRNSTRLVHKDHIGKSCSNPNDLWCYYQPVSNAGSNNSDCINKSCGGYFYPLTHSDGATFAPTYASTYLSWMVYLTGDLQSWFQDMLDEFKNIDCTKSGCMGNAGVSACKSHTDGTHGETAHCTCPSVVQCGGTLPLLYRHGFNFTDSYSLKDTTTKRSCENFHSALSNVLSRNSPLAKLLESIDDFLYMFRFYFFYNLSSFWLCSLLILLYFLIYGIDVLHFKSHVRFPSSHGIPPIGLLTSGSRLPITTLTYITQ